jgi:hypothetical protein
MAAQKSESPGGTGLIADQITNSQILPLAETTGKHREQIGCTHA